MRKKSQINREQRLPPTHVKLVTLIIAEILVGMSMSVLSFMLFYWVTEGVLLHGTGVFDSIISQFVQSFRTPILTNIMFFFTFLGSDVIVMGTVLITSLLLWKRKRFEAIYFLFIIGVGSLLNLIIKYIIARPRPLHPLYHEILYSFPSGHSMNSFVFYAILVFGVFHFTRKKRLSILLGVFMMGLVGIIGISRIYLGVHYPSDVVGGFVAGFWWIVTVLAIEKTHQLVHLLEKP